MDSIVIVNKEELTELVASAVNNAIQKALPKQNDLEKKEVFTNRQAMKYLNVSRSTLQRWRNEGRLPSRKVSGKILYTQADLEKLLDGALI